LSRLEEEKKTVDKLNEHLVQKQEEKKALTTKLRNFTHVTLKIFSPNQTDIFSLT